MGVVEISSDLLIGAIQLTINSVEDRQGELGFTLQISYKATVEMTPEVAHTVELKEATSAQIPADVLPYLNPSRYCASDLLG